MAVSIIKFVTLLLFATGPEAAGAVSGKRTEAAC